MKNRPLTPVKTSPKLITELSEGVLTLTLNRPDKLNAIDNELAQALLESLDHAAANTDVRAIRLRGSGRAFCAGRDVGAAPTEADLVLVQAVARALVRAPQPVLAQVQGWTVGAGFEWMLDADIVIAGESARFKLPEASLGVFVTGGLIATLPAMVGLGRAKALVLLGEAFEADDARAWGLIHKVVPDAALEDMAWQAALALAALAPPVAQQLKRAFNLVGLAAFDQALQVESDAQRMLGNTPLRR